MILEAIKPSVTEDMNAWILRPFLREEVEEVVKQMKPIIARALMVSLPCFVNLFGL